MKIKTTLGLKRFDKDYRLLEEKIQPSKSWTKGMLEILYLMHAGIAAASPYNMKDINNVGQDIDSEGHSYCGYSSCNLRIASGGGKSGLHGIQDIAQGGSGDYLMRINVNCSNIGIVIGTGVGAVTPTDYALGTQILNGSGVGLMEYGGTELQRLTFANPNGSLIIRRFFTNASGGGITVNEVGIYTIANKSSNNWGYSYYFCIARDLTGGVVVADTEILLATYTVGITV
ncbi:MAG: hypothetical protein PHG61_03295 [Candidatus Marinimicrobia bacterium]|nr:hypothetical protein [Candidatus Neomarinimicrobiota bacterium]